MSATTLYKSHKRPGLATQGANFNNVGILTPIGAIATAISVGSNNIIALYNSNTTTSFYATGDSTLTLGTAYTGSLPIPPSSYLFINMGIDQYIIGASGVYAFDVIDEANPTKR